MKLPELNGSAPWIRWVALGITLGGTWWDIKSDIRSLKEHLEPLQAQVQVIQEKQLIRGPIIDELGRKTADLEMRMRSIEALMHYTPRAR